MNEYYFSKQDEDYKEMLITTSFKTIQSYS